MHGNGERSLNGLEAPPDTGRTSPHIVVLAGPNGVGKTTASSRLLVGALAVDTFVNADSIAADIAPSNPSDAAVRAGREMLATLENLRESRISFGLETTLSGRSLAPWLRGCLASGYRVHLVFLWLPSPDLAIQRVAHRVRCGGHSIDEPVIRRRYALGLRNLWNLYMPIVSSWTVYDGSDVPPIQVASGTRSGDVGVVDPIRWRRIVPGSDRHG